jgi:hypothetical protein
MSNQSPTDLAGALAVAALRLCVPKAASRMRTRRARSLATYVVNVPGPPASLRWGSGYGPGTQTKPRRLKYRRAHTRPKKVNFHPTGLIVAGLFVVHESFLPCIHGALGFDGFLVRRGR